MNMRIISAKDHGDSFRTLESGRAVAFMMDDALLAGERAKAKKPDNWESSAPRSRKKPTAVCCVKTIRSSKS
jgi:glutamate/aspartate transport system substrate-binding protein